MQHSPSQLVSARDLTTVTHDGRILSQHLTFQVNTSEILLVSGPNGVGKSTLLRVLLGYQKPLRGSVSIQVPHQRVGYLPQLQNTDFHLPLTLRDILDTATHHAIDDQEILDCELLSQEHLNLSWKTASGGERKRTLITRILLQDPDLLVLDEPMNHLDPSSRFQVAKALEHFVTRPSKRGTGRSVIIISHEKSLGHLIDSVSLRKLILQSPQSPSLEELTDVE